MKKFGIILILLCLSIEVAFGKDPSGQGSGGGTAVEGVLGLKGLFNILTSWLTNSYIPKILALIFFAVGVSKAFAGNILQFFMMLGLAVLVSQGGSIVKTLTPDVKTCTREQQLSGSCP